METCGGVTMTVKKLMDELDAVRDQLEDISSREPRVRPVITRLDELFAELEDEAENEAKEET